MRDKSGHFVKGYSGNAGGRHERTVEMDAVDEVIG